MAPPVLAGQVDGLNEAARAVDLRDPGAQKGALGAAVVHHGLALLEVALPDGLPPCLAVWVLAGARLRLHHPGLESSKSLDVEETSRF